MLTFHPLSYVVITIFSVKLILRQPLEGLKQHNQHYFDAFPDAQFILKDMVAEGDKVTVRMVRTGTHKEEYIGIPPTGRTFSVDDLSIYRIVDGKIVEHWEVFDRYSMLVQLGVIAET